MSLTMSAKMQWLILLTLAWRSIALVPTDDIFARQDGSPNLTFHGISDSQFTSCAPATLNWIYVGPNNTFSFFATPTDASQDIATSTRPLPTFSDSSNPSIRSLHRRGDLAIPIASSISPYDQQLNLTSLPVPPGIYSLLAIMNPTTSLYFARSLVFTVQQGANTSCLSSLSSTSSTSVLSSSATSSDFASITPSDVSSTPPTAVPVGGVSSTPVNKGAIAGGIIAGVVVIIAAVLFFFIAMRRRRSREHSRAHGDAHSHPPAKRNFDVGARGSRDRGGRWGGLASDDSHLPPNESKVRRSYGNTGRQSNGAGVSQDDINSYLSRSGSANDGGYFGSPSEEKFSSSPSEEMVLSALPYRGPEPKVHVPKNNPRSSSTSMTNPFEHRHSQSNAWRSSLDSSSTHGQSTTPSPVSITRKPLPAAQNTPPKTTRKPVPAYHETSSVPAMTSAPTSPPVPATPPFADPVLPHPAPVSTGHYSTRAERESLKSLSSKSKLKLRKDKSDTSLTNTSREEISAQHELAHKNSFGPGGLDGKQLHYLIPDMPVGHR
ncbi:hypothetical protein C0992_007293 [Termitomyces sp. T32_za158]|nr:hypothetical protein C0992_007293 [Termitomyces sp. T32_za158]